MSFWQTIKNKIKYILLSEIQPEIIGYRTNFQGVPAPGLRISNLTHIGTKKNIFLGSHVYIAHFSFIEGHQKVTIGEGVAVNSYVTILTHSAHNAMRLYGEDYGLFASMRGLLSGEVNIGAYTFIGPNSVIMPGTTIGKGCIISAFSLVKGEFEDYSIISGNPAKVVGSTKEIDEAFLKRYPELNDFYYLKEKAVPVKNT